MIGVELFDARASALAVDESGAVVARAAVDAAGDLAAAAASAIETISRGQSPPAAIGLTSANPESLAIAAAAQSLARTFGASIAPAVTSAGTAAALAEAWIGAARGAHDVAYFAVGEHTTGGLVRGGTAMTGSHGRAASIAWLALNPVEREDYRRTGCLEAEVAAAGVVRRLIWRIKAGDRSRVQDKVADDFSAITLDHVLDAARGGDGVSISVVRDTAKYLGMAAANLVVVADPETLVLGGIMATAADLLLDPVRTEIGRRLPRAMMDALTIAPAALGADAAPIGAARLASLALQ
jgi:glucokinase